MYLEVVEGAKKEITLLSSKVISLSGTLLIIAA